MLTFLRKIRKSLIDSGSARKYTIYAIGEIALVVIGILIALQINNWNTSRIAKKAEKSILLEIKKTLQSDLDHTIGTNIDLAKSMINLTKSMLQEFEYGKRGVDTINYGALAFAKTFNPNTIPRDILQSKGVDMISNEKLRYAIINIYHLEYEQTSRFFENELHNVREIYRPVLRKWFDIPSTNSTTNRYISIDYVGMLKDRELKNAISISHSINEMMVDRLTLLKHKVGSLIEDIENELEGF